jgi:hypothetical protein
LGEIAEGRHVNVKPAQQQSAMRFESIDQHTLADFAWRG